MNSSGAFPLDGSSMVISNHTHIRPPNSTTTFALITFNNKLIASTWIVFAIITVLLNGLILASFFRDSRIRTPFNIYVVILAVLDILNALVSMPMAVINQLLGRWPFSAVACTMGLYFSQLANTGNRAVHLLIAGNRLWALTSPVSYRNYHSPRLSLSLVMCGWCWITCIGVPDLIVSRQSINHSMSAPDPYCTYDKRGYAGLHWAYNVLLYDAPEVIVLAAYPVLFVKLRQQLRNRIKPDGVDSPPDREHWGSRSHDRLFAYLVISVIVCWTPNNVFYLYASLTGVSINPLSTAQYLLGYANSWLHPILIYIADSQIRKAVKGLVKCDAFHRQSDGSSLEHT